MNLVKWLGYGTVEDLAKSAEESGLGRICVLAITTVMIRGTSQIVDHERAVLVEADLSDGIGATIGYVRIPVGVWTEIGGNVPDPDRVEAINRRARSLETTLAQWLTRRGFTVTPATYASPQGLTLLGGSADFLIYDKDSDTYHIAPEPGPEL
jgi:hypothetical protein